MPETEMEIETAVLAAAERVRRDPAGIIALRAGDRAGLQANARLHLRDLAGDAACTPINLEHVAGAAEAMGAEEPAPARGRGRPPRRYPHQWQPEACRRKNQECDERVGARGICIVCKARRKPAREPDPVASDDVLEKSRRIRHAQIAYIVKGEAYNAAGKPLGKVQNKLRRVDTPPVGKPQLRFRPGDEHGTVVVSYAKGHESFYARLRHFCNIPVDELARLTDKPRPTIQNWIMAANPTVTGTYTRDTLRTLILEKIKIGQGLLEELDDLDARALAGEQG